MFEAAVEQGFLVTRKEIAEGQVLLQKQSDRIRARFQVHHDSPGKQLAAGGVADALIIVNSIPAFRQ
ncbi:MAG: hypothetical protein ACREUL_01930 [Steroidobacteraceae bacterium]